MSIARTAELAACSIAQVKRVTALHRAKAAQPVLLRTQEPRATDDIV